MSNSSIPGFFTKKMAEYKAWQNSCSGDGESYYVIPAANLVDECPDFAFGNATTYIWIHQALDFTGSNFTQERGISYR
jgi:hypothetical protein